MGKIIEFIENIYWEIWLFTTMIESECNRRRLNRIQNKIRKKAIQNGKKTKEKEKI